MFTYVDGCSIEILDNDKVIIKTKDTVFECDEINKPRFYNGTGEIVIEYTGLGTDGNKIQSWAKASFNPESSSPLHYHLERTEDYYIIAGQATVILGNEEVMLSPGNHLQILPGQQHQVINKSKQEKLSLIVRCAPSWIREDMHLVQTETLKTTFTE